MEWWSNLSDQDQEAFIGLGAAAGGIIGTLSLRQLYIWLFQPRTAPAIQNQPPSLQGSSLEQIPLHQIQIPPPAQAGPADLVQARLDNIQVQVNQISETVQSPMSLLESDVLANTGVYTPSVGSACFGCKVKYFRHFFAF